MIFLFPPPSCYRRPMILNPSNGTTATTLLPADLQRALDSAIATGRFLIVVAAETGPSQITAGVFGSKDYPKEAIVPALQRAAALAVEKQSLVILPATTPNGILRAG